MQYTHTKAQDLINEILISLNDSNGVTYTREEVLLGISESIRILDCLAFLNRTIKTFNIPTNASIIDLTTISELDAFTTFDKLIDELKLELDRHLLEDSTSVSTINREVFDINYYDKLIERKTAEFLLETGLLTTNEELSLDSPPISSIQLTENILNVRRLSFLENDTYHIIQQETEDNILSFFDYSSINNEAIPKFFSLSSSPKNLARFYPRINSIGKLELLSIKRPSFISVTTLPIVTNLSWGIKYGILYEYFRQPGNGFDEKRADYCKSRWQQSINIGKNYYLILGMRFLDIPVSLDTLDSFDTFAPNWQNNKIDKIEFLSSISVAIVSWNMIALSAKLDSLLEANVELDFLANSIVPVTEDDFIQIPFEMLEALIAYTKHYLQIKIGGNKLFDGIEKLNSMFEAVAKENARLNIPYNEIAIVPYKTRIKQQIQKPIEAEGYELQTQGQTQE
jgi:hypothetical protein